MAVEPTIRCLSQFVMKYAAVVKTTYMQYSRHVSVLENGCDDIQASFIYNKLICRIISKYDTEFATRDSRNS